MAILRMTDVWSNPRVAEGPYAEVAKVAERHMRTVNGSAKPVCAKIRCGGGPPLIRGTRGIASRCPGFCRLPLTVIIAFTETRSAGPRIVGTFPNHTQLRRPQGIAFVFGVRTIMLMPISPNGCAQAASHRESAITHAYKQACRRMQPLVRCSSRVRFL